MKHAVRLSAALAIISLMMASMPGRSAQVPPDPQQAVFDQNCAMCHDSPATRAPTRTALRAMSPGVIVSALTDGTMQGPGAALSPAERVALANYLTGRMITHETPMAGACKEPAPAVSLSGPSYNGWGGNLQNWRYQPNPGIAAADLPGLAVKWAFGVPGAVAMMGQPTIVGGRVFVGAQSRHVYSLNLATGCYYWDYMTRAGVRTAITVADIGGRDLAFFGDRAAFVYAVDAATGKLVWRVKADREPRTQVTGAPVLFDGRLYVPISGGDDSAAVDPKYQCCKGRGALVALDAATGAIVWTTYTIPDARPLAKNAVGTQLWGPSGVSVWASPTIDAKRRVLYVGTGDNHSAPATDTSDAMLALSLDGGKILWVRQVTKGDMGNGACFTAQMVSCPQPHGPDADFGASPQLVTLRDGSQLLLSGQKSGKLWAFDPDDGRVVWSRQVGRGGVLGGIQWGPATDGTTVYVAISDVGFRGGASLEKGLVIDPARGGGLYAFSAQSGDEVWSAPPTASSCTGHAGCSPAQSAAVTATPDYVLSGSIDGHMRAFDTQTGKLLWDFDTARSFPTVNGVKANGGSIDSGGAVVAGGMMLVSSGYGLYGGRPGNVLIALAPRP